MKIQIKPSETRYEKMNPLKTFFIPKITNFHNYNFIRNCKIVADLHVH